MIVLKKDGKSERFDLSKHPDEKYDLADQEFEHPNQLKAALAHIAARDREKKL